MVEASPYAAFAWRPMGPKNCGGRIEAVDSPRGKPSVIYCGVGSGGVWKSVNGGLSWRHVFAHESTFAVGDVTVDPNDANVVWVGTGEAHLGGMSYDGTGVFRSGDGGETWRNMGLVRARASARCSSILGDSSVAHVAVIGPRRGAHSIRGVHVSRDGGESWEQTLAPGEHVGVIDWFAIPSTRIGCGPRVGTGVAAATAACFVASTAVRRGTDSAAACSRARTSAVSRSRPPLRRRASSTRSSSTTRRPARGATTAAARSIARTTAGTPGGERARSTSTRTSAGTSAT